MFFQKLLLILLLHSGNHQVAESFLVIPSTSSTTTRTTATTSRLFTASSQNEISSAIAVNPLVSSVKVSKTVEVFGLVKQLEAEGTAVTSLCVGEPDFLPPPQVLEATIQAVQAGQTQYTAVTGTLALRQAIANDLKRRKQNLTYNPVTEIVVGNGAKQCVYQGVVALAGVGDQVLIPAPYWPSYPEMVALTGATSVIAETTADTGYLLTAQQLRQTLEQHPNVKLMILCNPSNPTGGVYSRSDLEALATVLMDFPRVAVLADEIYERLVYPPPTTTAATSSDDNDNNNKDDWCPSFASIPNMFDRTLTVNGFSKAYAMTGYRLGYIAAPAHLTKHITTLQSQITSCASSISQAAGLAALRDVPDSILDDNVVLMQAKRDYVWNQLANSTDMPYVTLPPFPPRGAFYVLPDLSQAPIYHGDDTQLCLDLLQQQQLALVPGSSFGAPGCVRISYATSMEELELAMTKLKTFLQGL